MPIDVERERAALDWYEQRRDEFLSALELAHRTERPDQVIELATSFAPFLTRRSYWDEGEQVMQWAVLAANRLGDARSYARMLDGLGTIHRLQSRWGEAAAEFSQALERFREIGDPTDEARTLSNLGLVLRKRGEAQPAQEAFLASVELWRQLEPSEEQRFGLARSLNNLGMSLRDAGGYADARRLFMEALELRKAIGDAEGVSRTLSNLGQLALRERRRERG